MSQTLCPCGSGHAFSVCCEPLHAGQPAPSAEALMRSRYCAYVLGAVDYLVASTVPEQRAFLDLPAITAWSQQSEWLGLQIESATSVAGQPEHAWVTFVARWRDVAGEHRHREQSAFVRPAEHWLFIDPTVNLDIGRNDVCICASQRKFKKCCAAFLVDPAGH